LAIHDLQITSDTWSLGVLKEAFKHLIGLSSPQFKLCFFIDGLDEYEGDPEDIALFFRDLSCSYAKFCVSSRPWPVFQDICQGVPGLKLQDLTYDDVRLYVTDKLGKNKSLQHLLDEDPQNFPWLIEELVQKASGVFLWVALVVK
jgi:hypothetical protein